MESKLNNFQHLLNITYQEQNIFSRNTLGISEIGYDCNRYLWLGHKGFKRNIIDGNILRLFQLGAMIEDHIKNDMIHLLNINVIEAQHEVVLKYHDLTILGHLDGIIQDDILGKLIWECKSANDKNFQLIKNNGYQNFNRQYTVQLHAYMFAYPLEQSFITVYNKNNSEIYSEIIPLNNVFIQDIIEDVFIVLSSKDPPNIKDECLNHTSFKFKYCIFNQYCKEYQL